MYEELQSLIYGNHPNKIFSLLNYPCFLQFISRDELQEAECTMFWFLVVAASVEELRTVNVKQRMITLTNSGMGGKSISLKCFSILAFKSR